MTSRFRSENQGELPGENIACPVCPRDHEVLMSFLPSGSENFVKSSPCTGGPYEITDEAILEAKSLTEKEKMQLISSLIERRTRGDKIPKITPNLVHESKGRRPLPAYERAHRLLSLLAQKTEAVGDSVDVREDDEYFAWSESTSRSELRYFVSYLQEEGWIDATQFLDGSARCKVMVDGYVRLEESQAQAAVDSNQAFVDMWFDEELKEAYDKGIKPAIEETGYTPIRIDQKEHINKIDDEIIAEIRKSRFLVSDFTQGEDGARGGVYYEAGFAHGLGMDVIFTCHKVSMDSLHFDTSHYNHIEWETPGELQEKLANRIRATISG